MKPLAWYRFDNQASDQSVLDIYVNDIIGDWIDELINEWYGLKATLTSKAFLNELSGIADSVTTIRLHINSPGGDVFSALTIANALRDQQRTKGRTVETYVDGLAASAASIIAMAGSKVHMADNALLMIHNPWTVAMGEAKDMREAAATLDTIRGAIIASYQWHSQLETDAIAALMDATTWMSADEAVERGFATDSIQGLKAAASITPGALAKMAVPEQYRDRVAGFVRAMPTPAPALEVVRACKAAGFADLADELLAANLTLDQVKAKLTEATAAKETAAAAERERTAASTARAEQIRAICKAHGQTARAEFYVTSAKSVDDVKADILTLKAQLDALYIDPTIDPAKGGSGSSAPAAPVIDAGAIYRDRNRPATT